MKPVNPIYWFALHHITYLTATSAVQIRPTDLMLDFDRDVEAQPLSFNLVHPVKLRFASFTRGRSGTVSDEWIPDVLATTLSQWYSNDAEPFETVKDHFHQDLSVFLEYPGVDTRIEILVKARQDTLMSELNATLFFGLAERDRSGGLPPLPGGSRKARSWAMTPFYRLEAVGRNSVGRGPKVVLVIRCIQRQSSARMPTTDPDAMRIEREIERAIAVPRNNSGANDRIRPVKRRRAVAHVDLPSKDFIGMHRPFDGPPMIKAEYRSSSTAKVLQERAALKKRYPPRSMMLTSRSDGAVLTVSRAWIGDFIRKSLGVWMNTTRLGEDVGSYYPHGINVAHNYTDGASHIVEVRLIANVDLSMADLERAMTIALGGKDKFAPRPGVSAQPWLGTPIYWFEVRRGDYRGETEAIMSIVRKEQTNPGDAQTTEGRDEGTATSVGAEPTRRPEGVLTLLDQYEHRGALARLQEMQRASQSHPGAAADPEGPSLSTQASQGSLQWCRTWYCLWPGRE